MDSIELLKQLQKQMQQNQEENKKDHDRLFNKIDLLFDKVHQLSLIKELMKSDSIIWKKGKRKLRRLLTILINELRIWRNMNAIDSKLGASH